tara:strand:+ start:521 stop:1348 length:828 start_codon:yes stop_codon:yes gene_type:complete
MATSARITPAAQSQVTKALNKAADQAGESSVTSSESQAATETARASFVALMLVWAGVTKNLGLSAAETLEMVCTSFKGLKIRSGNAAKKEFGRLLKLYPSGKNMPRGTAEAARKNGSKGIRQRRRAVCDFLELLASDPDAAIDSVRLTSKLNWSEKTQIWAALKNARCEESRMMINVGTDSAGLAHPLLEPYAENYTVVKDKVSGVETCEVTTGPKGRTENHTVTISKRPSGEVYKELAAVIITSRNQLQVARKFVTANEDDQTLDDFLIPTIAE